ncbi:putative membrane protein YadS [Tunturiibacter psychrotolerans]
MVSRSIANDVNFAERVAVSAVVFAVLIAFLYGTLGARDREFKGIAEYASLVYLLHSRLPN